MKCRVFLIDLHLCSYLSSFVNEFTKRDLIHIEYILITARGVSPPGWEWASHRNKFELECNCTLDFYSCHLRVIYTFRAQLDRRMSDNLRRTLTEI